MRGNMVRREVGDRGGEGVTLNNLGSVYYVLGKQEESLLYYRQALDIKREIGDREGEGTTLYNIGLVYYGENLYVVALSFFILAQRIFVEVQSPDSGRVQEWIDGLRREIGDERFADLLKDVEPQAQQIVDKALRELE